jgi:hypothetical protein
LCRDIATGIADCAKLRYPTGNAIMRRRGPDIPLIGERRRLPRRTASLTARFRLETGPEWFPCRIRNISAAGVCLQVPDFPLLPDCILLDLDGVAVPIRCELSWTDKDVAGFRFVAAGSR